MHDFTTPCILPPNNYALLGDRLLVRFPFQPPKPHSICIATRVHRPRKGEESGKTKISDSKRAGGPLTHWEKHANQPAPLRFTASKQELQQPKKAPRKPAKGKVSFAVPGPAEASPAAMQAHSDSDFESTKQAPLSVRFFPDQPCDMNNVTSVHDSRQKAESTAAQDADPIARA